VFNNTFNITFNWKLNLIIIFDEFSFFIAVEYIYIQINQKFKALTEKWFANNVDLIIKAVILIRIISFLILKTLILRKYNEILRNIVIKMISSLVMMFILYALLQLINFLIMNLDFWYKFWSIASEEYITIQFFIIFIAMMFKNQSIAQFFLYTTLIIKIKIIANYIFWFWTIKVNYREIDKNWDKKSFENEFIDIKNIEFQYK